MSIEETVARFFPAGLGYDHTQAQRLIAWLESRGYVITPKEAKKAAQTTRPQGSVRARSPIRTVGAPFSEGRRRLS